MFNLFQKERVALKPPLRFHNTLSGTLDVFEPLEAGKVKMYNCGPTVYDRATIGNLRSYTFADTVRRALDAWEYEVKQVINITDFGHLVSDADEGEDKMTKGLNREGLALTMANMHMLAERYAEAFLEDVAALGVDIKKIDFPRASAYVGEQIALIQTLEEKGYAYKTSDGVYFDISKFSGYGKLGKQNLAGAQEGARLGVNKEKRNAADFALWKSDKKLGWDSVWGKGFPGWHIECTAMIFKLLGKQIDIHTGGVDHISIHHNNEIAQAEAITGKQCVRYWLHNEFITIENKRIGKSEGNRVLLSGLTDRGFSPRSLRYCFLTGHYRTPMNFTWDALEGANTALLRLRRLFLEMPVSSLKPDPEFIKDFYAAIANDLDTPRALARLWEMVKSDLNPAIKRASLIEADKILGLGLGDTSPAIQLTVHEDIKVEDLPPTIQTAKQERELARQQKDFAKADALRAQIEEAGYEVKDMQSGSEITKR